MYRSRLNRFIILAVCCTIFIFTFIVFKVSRLPNNIMLLEGQQQLYNVKLPVNVSIQSRKSDVLKLNDATIDGDSIRLNLSDPFKIQSRKKGKADFDIKLLGFIPIRHVTVNVIPQITVIPGGQSIGVKLTTKGIMVVGISEVTSVDDKQYNPSMEAGIQMGDTITKINGILLRDAEHISELVESSGGKSIRITVIRKNSKEFEAELKPIKSKEDQKYKIGAWVRDSTAGVGTLTFCCPLNNSYGALGHPITDIDTGVLLTVNTGKIVPSKIVSIQPGIKGRPGELRGLFVDGEDELGNIEKNTMCGIYGKVERIIENKIYKEPIPVAFQSQIKVGPAKILTTIDNSEVKEYDIVIERLTNQSKANSKSMIIRVTDKELLDKTGGIVQGMSGSPIIQDGRLVGAVTHVFINKPDMGYGIYVEWMLEEAGIDINKQQ